METIKWVHCRRFQTWFGHIWRHGWFFQQNMRYLSNSLEEMDLKLFYISSNLSLQVQNIALIVSEMEKAHPKCISKLLTWMAIFGKFHVAVPLSPRSTWILASYMRPKARLAWVKGEPLQGKWCFFIYERFWSDQMVSGNSKNSWR